MLKNRVCFVILTVAALLPARSTEGANEILRLTQDQNEPWQPATEYELAVREAKHLVDSQKCAAAGRAFEKLRKDFTGITGPDFDDFVKIEKLRCKGKLSRAAVTFGKFLADHPQSHLYEAALQRQFHIGREFLAGRKKKVLGIIPMSGHSEGVGIMDAIRLREGIAEPNGTGVRAAKAAAESYQAKGASNPENYDMAYYRWLYLYQESEPGRQLKKNALLGMARCKYAKYRGPVYDASCLENVQGTGAKSYYQQYKEQYTKDAGEIGADKLIKKINAQLAYKDLTIGQYYQKTRDKKQKAEGHNPANHYYQMVIDKWYKRFALIYPQDAKKFSYSEILQHVDTQLSGPPGLDSLYNKTANKNVAYFIIEHWLEAKIAKQALQLLTENSVNKEKKQ